MRLIAHANVGIACVYVGYQVQVCHADSLSFGAKAAQP